MIDSKVGVDAHAGSVVVVVVLEAVAMVVVVVPGRNS
jgi:hypothetical protein